MLFWASLSHRVYNHTLPMRLLDRVFGEDGDESAYAVGRLLRKLYSVVAFTLAGYVVHRALPRTRHAAVRAALIVALFSGCIEIAQKLHHAREGLRSNAFDVACGALGGYLAVMIDRVVRARGNVPQRRPRIGP